MDSKFINEFKNEMLNHLELAGVDVSQIDEEKFHNYCIANLKTDDLVIYNNVKQTESEVNSLKLVDMIMYSKTKPIITGYNTLFHNHTKAENIPGGFLDYLKATRSEAKKKMHAHVNDTVKTLFNSYDTKQLIMKLLANSYYGAFGQSSFHFFNVLLGPSVTAQGRQLISSAILGFEGFLGDNIFFYDFDELVQFIGNICKEEQDDDMIVETDFTIDVSTVNERLLSRCKFKLTEIQEEYINMVLENQSETGLQKLYFKNNLFKFLEVDVIKETITENLIINGFHDANNPPENIKEILAELSNILRYFVGYPYPYNSKTHHAATMVRKVVLVCDTDSNFLHVYPWLQYVCKNAEIDIPSIDNDTRVSIISVMTYFITHFIDEVFRILCGNSNVPEAEHHRINMKSEFHYKRVILTKNKKSYAGVILSKEGTVLSKPKFDVKGIPIKKVSTPKPARIFFSQLLESEMLNNPEIDIRDIYSQYHEFAKSVTDSVISGSSGYLKPGVLKTINSYKKPFQMQSVRASYIWNAVYPKSYIGQSTTFKILEFNPSLIPHPLKSSGVKDANNKFIMEDNPEFAEFLYNEFDEEVADRIINLFESKPEMKHYGLTQIAIPLDVEEIPKEFLKFADVGSITNSVLSKGNILLESLGFVVVKSRKRQVVSNIIRI